MIQKTGDFQISKLILGIDWEEHLPVALGDYWLDVSSYDEFMALKTDPDSFLITSDKTNDGFVKDGNSSLKVKYLRHFGDFFSIKKGAQTVGVAICELSDWTSYYNRFIFISEKHRGSNLANLFYQSIEVVLRSFSIDKFTVDISPMNFGQLKNMGQLGFICTGNTLSERFGANLRFTRFLNEKSVSTFKNNFIQSFSETNMPENNIQTINYQRSEI